MKHILASTTRQWNCGDEFILFGIRNLIPGTYAIYNRSPEVKLKKENLENSWRGQSLDAFDEIIIAGTPEWAGEAVSPLFEMCIKEERKPLFIGIGYPGYPDHEHISDIDKITFDSSPLVICRDALTQKILEKAEIKSDILPCPAIFSSKNNSIKNGHKLGFILQNDVVPTQSITSELKSECIKAIEELNCDVITHYIDEYLFYKKIFKNVRYSYDAIDYISILDEYDIIVSTRLHGALLAHSLGIPTILICSEDENNKLRLNSAGEQFPHLISAQPYEIEGIVNSLNTKELSEKIIAFKEQTLELYKKRSPHFHEATF